MKLERNCLSISSSSEAGKRKYKVEPQYKWYIKFSVEFSGGSTRSSSLTVKSSSEGCYIGHGNIPSNFSIVIY